MAKQDSKALGGLPRSSKRREERTWKRRSLLASAVTASLLISALLTLDLLPASSIGFGGRIPHVGDISERDYKAPAGVTIVDQEATAELRRKATENAAVVYDFDERRRESVESGIAAAFAAGRAAQQVDEEAEVDRPDPAARFRESLGEQTVVPDRSMDYLISSGFEAEDERLLAQLVQPIVSRMIVADPDEFARHREKRIVVVRELGSGNERRLTDADETLTRESAKELIEEAAKLRLSSLPKETRSALLPLAGVMPRPNLSFNLRASDERRQAAEAGVKEATVSLRKGEIIVRGGDPIDDRHVLIFRGIREQQRASSRMTVFAGVAMLLLISMSVIWRFGTRSLPRFPREPKDAVFILSALVFNTVGTGLGMFLCDAAGQTPYFAPIVEQTPGVLYFVIPVATATMLVRMVHNAETAALFAVLVSLLAALQVRQDLDYAFFTLAGSLTAALGAAHVTQRGTLLRAGVRVGLANALIIVALNLLDGQPNLLALSISAALGMVGGLLAGVLVTGFAPIAEGMFSYTTDIKLLELANREQPLLRELELRAPGTYHHSMMVGHLAEKAAEAIGANALLVKVAGYYHDIGKMRRPHFFVENATIHQGENRHERLSPSMSARIIQAHVKDGAEMGEKNKLAPPILQGIREHHGTSIIRFFYEKAKELADPEKGDPVAEHDYRYPGPRPQTRESGILMLADSVEAASRTLADTSPNRVQQLVQRIINNYFRDGQLDDCSLTLRDLHAIARSFIDTLSAIRHERIDYPDATDADGKKLEEVADEGVVERLEPRQKDRSERSKEKRDDDLKRLGLP